MAATGSCTSQLYVSSAAQAGRTDKLGQTNRKYRLLAEALT